ncbi:UNVERIFIED_CONTAM: hypothetical protein FKN15_056991, partial [Acipenser sinensis]
LPGLKKYTEYKLRVAASTGVGESSLSEEDDIFARTMEDEPESAPQNLTVQHVTASTAVISWLPPEKPNGIITYYKVTYAVDTDFHTENSTTTIATLQNLKPHSVYTISIRAYTKYGHGNQTSSVLKVLTGEDAPGSPPFNLTYESISSTKVEVSWIPPLHANGIILSYTIEYWNASHSLNISSNSTTAILSNLRKYTQYCVTVSAHTKFGNGNQTSDILNVTTLEDAPFYLQGHISHINIRSTSIPVLWTPSSKPNEIIHLDTIYYSNSSGVYIQVIAWDLAFLASTLKPNGLVTKYQLSVDNNQTYQVFHPEVSVVSVSHNGLRPFTSYGITISTCTSKGPGPSYSIKVTTAQDIPDAVQNLHCIGTSWQSVLIQWDPPTNSNGIITHYIVQFGGDAQELKPTDHVYTVRGLLANTTYTFRVIAATSAGIGKDQTCFAETLPESGKTLPESVPSAPKDLNITKIQSSSVTLSWTRPDVVPGYLQNYRVVGQLLSMLCNNWNTSGCIENKVIQYVSGTDDSLETSIYSLLKFRRYRFSVAASTNAGYGNSTDWISTNTLPGNPDTPPQNVTAVSRSYHAIDISWRAPEVVTGPTAYLIDVTSVYAVNGAGPGPKTELKITMDIQAPPESSMIPVPAYDKHGAAIITARTMTIQMPVCFFSDNHGPIERIQVIIAEAKAHRYHPCADSGGAKMNTRCPPKRVPSAARFFTHCELTVQPPQSYSVGGQRSSGQLKGKPTGARPGYRGRWCSELPKLLQDLATSDADLPWNRSKNRFTNIKPYNNNRVKLIAEAGVPGSDYINASYVSGYLCPNEFIATQGPLPGTVADFWRMIWETRTRTIAMLTQCFEKGRIRCHQYWPEDNKPVTVFGDIVITKLTEDVHPDWTIRDLKVERHGDCMVVRHFSFTSWPEHGVPESSTALIHFVKLIRVNRAHDNTTIAVHCSAGVGRTGVFIGLDHLVQHVSDHDFVDIYGLVAELRSERMCMVQNLAQYMFLHQCALDLLSSKGNSQSIWFVNYSALEKMDSLEAMEGDVELEWEETTM